MMLVDTTVLVDYFRSRDRKILARLQKDDAAVCGVVRAEVLHGARDPKQRKRLLAALDALNQISISDQMWDSAGDNLATLRAAGVTVPFGDAVIATVALSLDIEL